MMTRMLLCEAKHLLGAHKRSNAKWKRKKKKKQQQQQQQKISFESSNQRWGRPKWFGQADAAAATAAATAVAI
ncbi:hypothetical protein AWZ03_012205 [Drosophila navojoa]|uniref:Uncharacterized protein n=1 Tax=Drosophila navojoa TaxID=7232 RepID=A0A484B0L3_DRONA|nr:hypothetical protein AWZ03_012205 [Drosophila navojoa]